MSVSRKIHFNALSESMRRRWADLTCGRKQPGPLYAEPLPFGVMRFGLLALLGLATISVSCWCGFGLPEAVGAVQSPAWLISYTGGGFMLAYGIPGLMRQSALRKALRFAPGRTCSRSTSSRPTARCSRSSPWTRAISVARSMIRPRLPLRGSSPADLHDARQGHGRAGPAASGREPQRSPSSPRWACCFAAGGAPCTGRTAPARRCVFAPLQGVVVARCQT
jgi:hypothetical protein